MVLDFLAVDNFDFTRKIVKKKFGWKTVFCQNWIFGQKFDFSNSVFDKNAFKKIAQNDSFSLTPKWPKMALKMTK